MSRLDPWGRGAHPGPYPLRPDVVDFAFAPPHGWGALALVLLGREGDVYTMCPFAPWVGPPRYRSPHACISKVLLNSSWKCISNPVSLISWYTMTRRAISARP